MRKAAFFIPLILSSRRVGYSFQNVEASMLFTSLSLSTG